MEADCIAKRRRNDMLHYKIYQLMQQQAMEAVVTKRRATVATAMMAVATAPQMFGKQGLLHILNQDWTLKNSHTS